MGWKWRLCLLLLTLKLLWLFSLFFIFFYVFSHQALTASCWYLSGCLHHILSPNNTPSRSSGGRRWDPVAGGRSQRPAMVSARLPGQVVDVSGANWSAPALGRPLCLNGTPWILYLLEECVDNVWEYCSVVIGLISMFCFLLSTLP